MLAECTLVRLNPGECLATPGTLLPQAYFPLDSWVALVAQTDAHRLDLALVGNEGVIGASMVLDVGVAPTLAIVRGEGTALAIGAQAVRRHLARSVALNHAFQHRVFFEMSQAARAAACCRFHLAEKRLAGYPRRKDPAGPSPDPLFERHDRDPAAHATAGRVVRLLRARGPGPHPDYGGGRGLRRWPFIMRE